MPAPKLTTDQRAQLLEWIAADYAPSLILHWIAQRRGRDPDPEGWPELSKQAISYYRTHYADKLAKLQQERRAKAITSGLALKEERLARLAEHADRLEVMKWLPDKNGRLWNEKAWREVLDDIAKEMGHRRQGIDITLERELEAFLDRLRDNLDEATYARVLAFAAGSAADRE